MLRRTLPIAAILLLMPLAAHAQAVNAINEVVTRFQGSMNGWEGGLQRAAENTFGILAMCQVAWALAQQAIRRGSFGDFIECLVREILFVGFFFWLLTSYTTWNPAIIDSFRQAAGAASGVHVLTPGDVFAVGVDAFERVIKSASLWNPAASAVLGICSIVVLITFALICATMCLALIQAAFISNAGVLLMAFGASQITKELALAVVRLTLGVGARLFALQLIVAIGVQFIHQWIDAFDKIDVATTGIMVAQSVVLLVISWEIPNMIERAVGGSGFANGGAVFGAAAGLAAGGATVARATGAGAGAVINTGSALGAGAGAAQQTMAARTSAGTAPQNAALRMAQMTGMTVKNAVANSELGERLRGRMPPGARPINSDDEARQWRRGGKA